MGRLEQSLAWKKSMDNLWEEQPFMRCLNEARRLRGQSKKNPQVPRPELVGGFNIHTSYRINLLLLRSLIGAAPAPCPELKR